MASIHDDNDEITGINITPMVDVVLVLLIIFMVTTTYIVNRTINVNLPKAETGEKTDTTKNLAFVIDKTDKLFVDGKSIQYTEIAAHIQQYLAQAKEQNTKVQALITADAATPHGSVIKLIDLVRKSGINDFALNVEATVKQDDGTP